MGAKPEMGQGRRNTKSIFYIIKFSYFIFSTAQSQW